MLSSLSRLSWGRSCKASAAPVLSAFKQRAAHATANLSAFSVFKKTNRHERAWSLSAPRKASRDDDCRTPAK